MTATDGRQALVEHGWKFPWTGDVLVAGNSFFASREVVEQTIAIGRAGDFVTFAIGPWTLWLRESDGRFPKVEDVLPRPEIAPSQLWIDPQDAAFALEAIKRLPLQVIDSYPLAIDLNGEVILRAKPPGTGPATELLLARSRCQGARVTVFGDRRFLSRALGLGFTNFALSGPRSIVQAHDAQRQYVWMPLAYDSTASTGQEVRRLSSLDAAMTHPPRRSKPQLAGHRTTGLSSPLKYILKKGFMICPYDLGLSKKIGLPAYGSLGASCHLELELDQSLLDSDVEGFHERVRRIYAACRQAVYEELARHQEPPRWEDSPETNGEHGNAATLSAMASAKQIEYAEQLARQIRGLGFRKLEALAQKLHEKPLAALSGSEASALIDVLRELKKGTRDVAEVLNGAQG